MLLVGLGLACGSAARLACNVVAFSPVVGVPASIVAPLLACLADLLRCPAAAALQTRMFCQFDGPSSGAVVLREVRRTAALRRCWSTHFRWCALAMAAAALPSGGACCPPNQAQVKHHEGTFAALRAAGAPAEGPAYADAGAAVRQPGCAKGSACKLAFCTTRPSVVVLSQPALQQADREPACASCLPFHLQTRRRRR